MLKSNSKRFAFAILIAAIIGSSFTRAAYGAELGAAAASAYTIEGQVLGAGAPIAKSTVTLWSASADAPKQLAQTQSGDDGHFTLSAEGSPDSILYIVAQGGVAGSQQGRRRQPGDRTTRGHRQQAAGTRRHQRVHDGGVGMDQRSVPRRHFDQRQPARSAHRGRQRAQFRRSRDRRLRRNDSGPLQQHRDADNGQLRYLVDVLAGCVTSVTAMTHASSLFVAAVGRDGKDPIDTLTAAVVNRPQYRPTSLSSIVRAPR